MQAIILAAGEGSRMRPLTSNRPKVMLPVCGRPILEQIVFRAKQADVERFVFVVGYGADAVKSHFGDGSDLGTRIDYVVQDRQLGTGHALLAAEAMAEDRFFVLNGDVLPDAESLKSMITVKGNAVAAKRVPDPSRYGVFVEDGGYMKSVIEKSETPPSDLANAGIYIFESEIFEATKKAKMSKRGEYELTDGLNILAKKEKIKIIEFKDWIEIGRPWDILIANEKLMPDVKAEVKG